MNSKVTAEIRARVAQKIDLRAITGEQAVYAVLDRALLFAILENSWWRQVGRGFVLIAFPCSVITVALFFLRAPFLATIAPAALGVLLLIALGMRDLLTLAREGSEARIVASMSRAVQPVETPTVELPQ